MATDKAERQERFTNQKRFVVTEEQVKQKWGDDGKGLKCGICGHRFVANDGARWVYANGNTPSYCNFFTCDSCDGPDVLERRTAAGDFAKSLQFDEIVIAAQAQSRTAELERLKLQCGVMAVMLRANADDATWEKFEREYEEQLARTAELTALRERVADLEPNPLMVPQDDPDKAHIYRVGFADAVRAARVLAEGKVG